jgi:hypothetical protein
MGWKEAAAGPTRRRDSIVEIDPLRASKECRTMAEFRFVVDAVEASRLVTGRNEIVDIPLGTTFTTIKKCRVDGDRAHPRTVELGVVADVHLTLKEVVFYGRSIDVVPAGHTVGLMVEGDGLSLLIDALQDAADREYVSLAAPLPSEATG